MSSPKPVIRRRQRPQASKPDSGGHDPHRPVGYANPPKANQFKKGQSGNPKGRPKGSKSLSTILNERLNKRIKIREGGRTKTVSVLEAKITQLTKSMLEGDDKATNLILKLLHHHGGETDVIERGSEPAFSEEDDRKVIEELLRLSSCANPSEEDS
jgi:hypothetical protein